VIPYERDFPRRNKARKWLPLSDKALGENSFEQAIAGRQQEAARRQRLELNRQQPVEQERMQEAALRQQLPSFMEQSSRLEGKSTDLILMQPDKRLSRHDVVQGPN
jgi:hypothetical protein